MFVILVGYFYIYFKYLVAKIQLYNMHNRSVKSVATDFSTQYEKGSLLLSGDHEQSTLHPLSVI